MLFCILQCTILAGDFMEETFDLPGENKGKYLLLKGVLITTGYSHRFTAVIFQDLSPTPLQV
jgi:hypothetical protein